MTFDTDTLPPGSYADTLSMTPSSTNPSESANLSPIELTITAAIVPEPGTLALLGAAPSGCSPLPGDGGLAASTLNLGVNVGTISELTDPFAGGLGDSDPCALIITLPTAVTASSCFST